MRGGGRRDMSLRKSRSGKYSVRIYFNGKAIERSCYTTDYDLAKEFEQKLLSELQLPKKPKIRNALGITGLKRKLRLLSKNPGFWQALLEMMEE
jgi:hypothetical protein